MFLTHDELCDLTGSPRKKRQIEWLLDNGFRFVTSLSGKPKVLQAEVERVMLGSTRQKKQQPKFNKING